MSELPWLDRNFTDRQAKEIIFSQLYASEFQHGTDGHNTKMIIAQLANLITSLHFELIGRNYPENIRPIMGYDLKEQTD